MDPNEIKLELVNDKLVKTKKKAVKESSEYQFAMSWRVMWCDRFGFLHFFLG